MFLVGDILIWSVALYAAYYVRFEGDIPVAHMRRLLLLYFVFIPPKILWHYLFRLYRVTWRLIGLTDLVNVWKANSLASASIVVALVFLRSVPRFEIIPRSVLLLDYVFSVTAIVLFRFGRRLWDFHRDGLRRSKRL